MARLLEGKPLAEKIKAEVRTQVKSRTQAPVLASILVEGDSASLLYSNAQKKVAQELGIEYRLHSLPKDTTEEKLKGYIHGLNRDVSVHGIIVQLPLPEPIDHTRLIQAIAPQKDVEGLHPANIGKLLFAGAGIVPCTAAAVMELLKATGIPLYGKEAVIVGHSSIVGKPLSLLLLEQFATVTVCHIATSEAGKLEEHCARAQVLIVAAGKPGLIKGKDIGKGAVVIDVGINRIGGKTVGDVEFEAAAEKASWITPVPGGVGPLTVVMLMRNLLEAVKLQGGNG